MHPSRTHLAFYAALIAGALIMLGSPNASGFADPPKPAKVTKAATPAKAPGTTTVHPGAAHGPTTAGSHGPMAGGASHGPTTAGRGSIAGGAGAGRGRPGDARAGGGRPNAGFGGRAAPRGSQDTRLRNGSEVQRRPNGRISDVHDARRGMDIHHGLNGSRRVSMERADHSRIVGERGRPGYVQRGYNYRGHDYARRTYYYHGRQYDRYYRGYSYHGVEMGVYAPVRYYPAAFYGWAYNPWVQPIAYPWGWAANPWYGLYGAYFTPYPVYSSASLWLTDYLIAADLQAAYAAQQEAALQGPTPQDMQAAALTPEVKQMISDEVRSEIALENAEGQQNGQGQDPDPGSSGIARLMADGRPHVFVAGSDLDLVDAQGVECSVTDGDALELLAPPAPDAADASLLVLSSKGGQECRKSDTVTVALADLQEMQNHLRENIDQGLQELQAKQGQGGLPQSPPSAQAAPVDVAFTQIAPPPDPNGAAEVDGQLQQANQSEQEVATQAQQEGAAASPTDASDPIAAPIASPAAPTQTIGLGQSIDQVTSILGPPVTVIDLGPKKIYQYKDMKVTFKSGKVSDVQ